MTTNTRDRSPAHHRTDVHRSASFPTHYLARCKCGWEGRAWPMKGSAQADGDEHELSA